ncbi:MAG: RnfABCDGE type electron transport complex subunit D [Clostridia bacterium]|nr:RnfABCDGE type electron transport complex subunit D [Clostridia bacterium]
MNLSLATGPHLLPRQSTRRIMLDVLIALAPSAVAGVYLFGGRAAVVLAASVLSAVLSELAWKWLARKPVGNPDLSAAVTGLILGLNLPSSTPWWAAVVGSAFAIVIAKELFGGIGHNFLNPALVARAVLLASWPRHLTTFFLPQRLIGLSSAAKTGDAISSATPLVTGKASFLDLLFGNIPGTIGEVCKIAILVGFAYMLLRGIVGAHIPLLFVGTVAALTWLYGSDPLAAVLSGGVLFGAVFMATDYVTNPMLPVGQCAFAVGCGVIVVIIRIHGMYPEGVTYAILIMNILTPLIDRFTKRRVYGEVRKNA